MDYSGTGHQPMYYDVFTSLYNRYIPRAAKLTVTYVNTNAFPVTVLVFPLGGWTAVV